MMTLTTEKVTGKVVALYFPILVFVLCGFEHSVANMSYISGGLFANMEYGSLGIDVSGLTWYRFFVGNLLPVTLGNIVGGCLAGIAYWSSARNK
jgi:formate/nitrite transporter FocA (FNT family)